MRLPFYQDDKARIEGRKVRYRKLAGTESMVVSSYVPGSLVALIDHKVACGEYRSRSDFVLCAIRDYSRRFDEKGKK
jgi:hypothetical protein